MTAGQIANAAAPNAAAAPSTVTTDSNGVAAAAPIAAAAGFSEIHVGRAIINIQTQLAEHTDELELLREQNHMLRQDLEVLRAQNYMLQEQLELLRTQNLRLSNPFLQQSRGALGSYEDEMSEDFGFR